MLVLLMLLALLAVSGGTVVALDRNSKQLKQLKASNNEMRQTLGRVSTLVYENKEIAPLLADVITYELDAHRRRLEIER